MIIMVTGCAGFLGLAFVKNILRTTNFYIHGIDKETYAANKQEIDNIAYLNPDRFKYELADIKDLTHLPDVDAIVNFAAETHVDNSIMDSRVFIESNVLGVQNLLELIRAKRNYEMPRFIQISTDEVYGDTFTTLEPITEYFPLSPSNPYAASKAAADLLIQSYARTYGIDYNIIRPSNCYGSHQYHEKLIPKTIRHLELNRKIPIHGDGNHKRSWLHAQDLADAVRKVILVGEHGEIFNIPGDTQSINSIVETIVNVYYPNQDFTKFCKFDYNRKGLDLFYKVSSENLDNLGWSPNFKNVLEELPHVVQHYKGKIRL